MKKASLTVFLSLSLSILLSFVLFVMEIAVVNSQKMTFDTASDLAMDSVMGEYSTALLQRYGFFYVDTSYLETTPEIANLKERIQFYMMANTVERAELGHAPWGKVIPDQTEIVSYETAAARGGASVRNQAICYMEMQENCKEQAACAYRAIQDFSVQSPEDEIQNFRMLMEQIGAMELPVIEREDGTKEEISLGNPADYVYSLVGSEVLFLCGADLSQVSNMRIDQTHLVSGRGMLHDQSVERNFREDPELFYAYLLEQFGNYRKARLESVLTCQLEYMLAGEASSYENLRETAGRIFYWRMWDNTRLALSDGGLYEEAAGYVSQLQAVILKEEFREPVIQSILYACAFLESVSDLRSLLEGGTVALRKQEHHMKVASVVEGRLYQNGTSGGLSYEQYLLGMLSLDNQQQILCRMMDLIEMDIREMTGNPYFQMDECVERVEVKFSAKGAFGRTYEAYRKYGYY